VVKELDPIPLQMKWICVDVKVRDPILFQMEHIYVDVKVRDMIDPTWHGTDLCALKGEDSIPHVHIQSQIHELYIIMDSRGGSLMTQLCFSLLISFFNFTA